MGGEIIIETTLGNKGAALSNPADPPLFESEASYLDRLGLLTKAERQALTAADFQPVAYIPTT